MKYPAEQMSVGVIYDNAPADNPFLAAMPGLIPQQKFMNAVKSMPPLPAALPYMSSEERRQALPLLSALFIPLDYMYAIYDQLYRAITTTYTTRTVIEAVRQSNALFRGDETVNYSTQADTGSVLGVPGIGKTSTIRRCLSLMPQVIEHTEYQGQPFFCKQVLYLHIECPSDCSIKTLALNLVSALDRAIGSDYLNTLTSLRSVAASALATQVKILCMTHHVGLILVDEIQNAVLTSRQNRQVKPLIKFLVELTNDTSTGIYFVGTPMAEELFTSQEHLRRRTRGIRLLPLKPDGTYRRFLEQLWSYQLTPRTATLSEKMANKLYDFSGGIPAYIIKIFQESQAQALLMGMACIDEKIMQRAIDILAIKVPKTYSGGTHISDFSFPVAGIAEPASQEPSPLATHGPADIEADRDGSAEPGAAAAGAVAVYGSAEQGVAEAVVGRLYANRRGRPAAERDPADLLAAYKNGCNIQDHLRQFGLLEVWPPC